MNTCTRVSLDYTPRSGTAGSSGMHIFSLSTWGRARESSKQEAPGCLLPVESWAALAPLRDNAHNTHGVLTTREGCLSLAVQSSFGLGHRDMVYCLHGQLFLKAAPAGVKLIPCGPRPQPSIHCQHRQSGVAKVPREIKALLPGRAFQERRGYLTEAKSKGQISL